MSALVAACSISNDECSPPGGRITRKMCDAHYTRWYRHGDPRKCAVERHGMTGTPEHDAWSHMIQRCTNPKSDCWAHYGGRGITVCERWLNSFAAFYEDMGPRPDGLTLERIDNGGNYEPDNCCWATWSDQIRNRRKRQGTSSRYRGVSWNKEKRKWEVAATIDGKRLRLGYFVDEEDAARAYEQAVA